MKLQLFAIYMWTSSLQWLGQVFFVIIGTLV
jgi:hypothetical protein